jgi:signal transduction histidine kinase
MQELHLLTRGALAEMRTLLMELRPEFLLKSPLSTQIRQLGDAVRSRKRLEIEFSFSGSGTLPPEVQIAFYRIAQEIFNNIVKHSGASNVTVTLKSTSDHVLLDIIDDGVGFDVENTPPGIGMMTMHERADAINAAFTIESSPGRGTHIRVMWPRDDTRR